MQKSLKIPKSHSIRNSIIAFFVVMLVVLIYSFNRVFINDTVTGLFYRADSEIAEVIKHLDLTDDGMRILRATYPELQKASDFNRNCPSVNSETSTLGCYYNGRIYVYDIDNSELEGIKEAVLAHELLHAIWDRMPSGQQGGVAQYLMQVYSDNKDELSEHMSNYEATDFTDELHSVVGTQLDSSKLGSVLRNHYARYFNDIDRVFAYFSAYDEILSGQRKTANLMYDEIIKLKAEIDSRSQAYEQENEKLNADIDDYNARASKGYSTLAERDALEAERQQLITRQTLQQNEYEALNTLVKNANQKVEEYNKLVEHLGELMKSVDSTYINIPEAEKIAN